MTNEILSVFALCYDSGAAIINNREIIAADQEERFTRKKHDLSIPVNQKKCCLREAGESIDKLNVVNPLLTLDRFLNNAIVLGEDAQVPFEKSLWSIFASKLWVEELLKKIWVIWKTLCLIKVSSRSGVRKRTGEKNSFSIKANSINAPELARSH